MKKGQTIAAFKDQNLAVLIKHYQHEWRRAQAAVADLQQVVAIQDDEEAGSRMTQLADRRLEVVAAVDKAEACLHMAEACLQAACEQYEQTASKLHLEALWHAFNEIRADQAVNNLIITSEQYSFAALVHLYDTEIVYAQEATNHAQEYFPDANAADDDETENAEVNSTNIEVKAARLTWNQAKLFRQEVLAEIENIKKVSGFKKDNGGKGKSKVESDEEASHQAQPLALNFDKTQAGQIITDLDDAITLLERAAMQSTPIEPMGINNGGDDDESAPLLYATSKKQPDDYADAKAIKSVKPLSSWLSRANLAGRIFGGSPGLRQVTRGEAGVVERAEGEIYNRGRKSYSSVSYGASAMSGNMPMPVVPSASAASTLIQRPDGWSGVNPFTPPYAAYLGLAPVNVNEDATTKQKIYATIRGLSQMAMAIVMFELPIIAWTPLVQKKYIEWYPGETPKDPLIMYLLAALHRLNLLEDLTSGKEKFLPAIIMTSLMTFIGVIYGVGLILFFCLPELKKQNYLFNAANTWVSLFHTSFRMFISYFVFITAFVLPVLYSRVERPPLDYGYDDDMVANETPAFSVDNSVSGESVSLAGIEFTSAEQIQIFLALFATLGPGILYTIIGELIRCCKKPQTNTLRPLSNDFNDDDFINDAFMRNAEIDVDQLDPQEVDLVKKVVNLVCPDNQAQKVEQYVLAGYLQQQQEASEEHHSQQHVLKAVPKDAHIVHTQPVAGSLNPNDGYGQPMQHGYSAGAKFHSSGSSTFPAASGDFLSLHTQPVAGSLNPNDGYGQPMQHGYSAGAKFHSSGSSAFPAASGDFLSLHTQPINPSALGLNTLEELRQRVKIAIQFTKRQQTAGPKGAHSSLPQQPEESLPQLWADAILHFSLIGNTLPAERRKVIKEALAKHLENNLPSELSEAITPEIIQLIQNKILELANLKKGRVSGSSHAADKLEEDMLSQWRMLLGREADALTNILNMGIKHIHAATELEKTARQKAAQKGWAEAIVKEINILNPLTDALLRINEVMSAFNVNPQAQAAAREIAQAALVKAITEAVNNDASYQEVQEEGQSPTLAAETLSNAIGRAIVEALVEESTLQKMMTAVNKIQPNAIPATKNLKVAIARFGRYETALSQLRAVLAILQVPAKTAKEASDMISQHILTNPNHPDYNQPIDQVIGGGSAALVATYVHKEHPELVGILENNGEGIFTNRIRALLQSNDLKGQLAWGEIREDLKAFYEQLAYQYGSEAAKLAVHAAHHVLGQNKWELADFNYPVIEAAVRTALIATNLDKFRNNQEISYIQIMPTKPEVTTKTLELIAILQGEFSENIEEVNPNDNANQSNKLTPKQLAENYWETVNAILLGIADVEVVNRLQHRPVVALAKEMIARGIAMHENSQKGAISPKPFNMVTFLKSKPVLQQLIVNEVIACHDELNNNYEPPGNVELPHIIRVDSLGQTFLSVADEYQRALTNPPTQNLQPKWGQSL